jgi:hypothetical protein
MAMKNDSDIPFENYSRKQHHRVWQETVRNANRLAAARGDKGNKLLTADVGHAAVPLEIDSVGCFRKIPVYVV